MGCGPVNLPIIKTFQAVHWPLHVGTFRFLMEIFHCSLYCMPCTSYKDTNYTMTLLNLKHTRTTIYARLGHQIALLSTSCTCDINWTVMSDIGGASEQVLHGQTGLLFEPGDLTTLAGHLQTLESASVRARMGSAAQRRVRQLFTVETMTAGFTGQIERLLGTRGSSPALESRATPGSYLA